MDAMMFIPDRVVSDVELLGDGRACVAVWRVGGVR